MTPDPTTPHVARKVLAAFALTFLAARILVLLIMSRRIPDLFLHLGGTHVHHLNYGIFLLSGVAGYLLFARPQGRAHAAAAFAYGVALALTFDEFGMWIHLGGAYWQRASFDAVVVIAALLGLIAFAPELRRLRSVHWATAALLLCGTAVFASLLVASVRHTEDRLGPSLERLERSGPQ
jgi:hypothetical protein